MVKEEADKEVVVVEGEEVQHLQLDTEKYVEGGFWQIILMIRKLWRSR